MRLTKTYPNGTVTLDASQFGVNQEVLDIEIRNSEPIKAAVERLKELEYRDEPRKPTNYDCCPSCDKDIMLYRGYPHCPHCGQALDWSEA